jgi:hypothetical protein
MRAASVAPPADTTIQFVGRARVLRRAIVPLLLIACASGAALLPLPDTVVERWFSRGLYPRVERVLTPISNLLPIAWLDLLLLGALVALAWKVWMAARQARRTRSASPLGWAALHVGATLAVVYLVFLALWGLNYRRVPMADRLVLSDGGPTSEEVEGLGLRAVSELNALYETAHAEGWSRPEWRDPSLVDAFDQVQRLFSNAPLAVPGRLKRSALGPYFRWTSVDGMVNPFALEVLANPDLLPFERPFVAAHEWSHLAGYADESEANFVGWLTCIRASPAAQYSGWLYLYWQVSGEVSPAERARLWEAMGQGSRDDVTAVLARLQRDQLPALRAASWQIYDQYLKANRVQAGVRSYGAVLSLILRAEFDDDWVPARR